MVFRFQQPRLKNRKKQLIFILILKRGLAADVVRQRNSKGQGNLRRGQIQRFQRNPIAVAAEPGVVQLLPGEVKGVPRLRSLIDQPENRLSVKDQVVDMVVALRAETADLHQVSAPESNTKLRRSVRNVKILKRTRAKTKKLLRLVKEPRNKRALRRESQTHHRNLQQGK